MAVLTNKHFVFRADASNIIGAGHVMRCLTLADAIGDQGGHCYFISRDHQGNLNAYIQERGYPLQRLPFCTDITPVRNNHPSWLSTAWQQDAQETIAAITSLNIKPDWLFVDHYGIEKQWHQTLVPHTKQLAVIDDLADRSYCCDLLIDQLCQRTTGDYQKLVNANTQLLLGSQYATIRPIFSQLRTQALKKYGALSSINRVFISMGGTDLLNANLAALRLLKNSQIDRNIHIDILVGQQSGYLHSLRDKNEFPFAIHIHPVSTPIHELMLAADIAIGAGGSTAWERCCLGLPTFLITIAQNQHDAARGLEQHKAAVWLGDIDKFDELKATELFNSYINDIEKLKVLTKNSSDVVDGRGCTRIIEKLASY